MATLNCLRLKLKSECLMSRIVLPPLPVDGSDLLTNKSESNVNDAYTKSLYTALGERDVGLMSTLNGKLEYVNLNSDFKVKSYPTGASFTGPNGVYEGNVNGLRKRNTFFS